jgi:hypothetical protein
MRQLSPTLDAPATIASPDSAKSVTIRGSARIAHNKTLHPTLQSESNESGRLLCYAALVEGIVLGSARKERLGEL